MFEYLFGPLAEITPSYAVVDCAGVGYHIEITLNTYTAIKELSQAKLYVHHVVREDAQLLYGFVDREEREMFLLLIAISGVGPNTARMVLSSLTVEELKEAVSTQNVKRVQQVKGIGAKGAQRIILELSGKLSGLGLSSSPSAASSQNMEEALSALVMLGFPKPAAEKALQAIFKQQPTLTVEEFIKEALGKL